MQWSSIIPFTYEEAYCGGKKKCLRNLKFSPLEVKYLTNVVIHCLDTYCASRWQNLFYRRGLFEEVYRFMLEWAFTDLLNFAKLPKIRFIFLHIAKE